MIIYIYHFVGLFKNHNFSLKIYITIPDIGFTTLQSTCDEVTVLKLPRQSSPTKHHKAVLKYLAGCPVVYSHAVHSLGSWILRISLYHLHVACS